MGYKGVCIHDRERKGVKMGKERDECVGFTYQESERQVGWGGA